MNTYKSTLALGIKEGIVYKWSQRLPQYTKVQREQTLIILQLKASFFQPNMQWCNQSLIIDYSLACKLPFYENFKQVNLNDGFGCHYLNSYWLFHLCISVVRQQIHGATFFEECFLETFPLRMGNKFLSGCFRSVVGPVPHLVARWRQH